MKKPHTTFTSITWHKASLWTQVYKCLQVLRQTRKAEELRTRYDACALREACAEARTSSRVTEGQLCQCFLHYVREYFLCPPKANPLTWAKCHTAGVCYLKCQLEQKCILDFTIICFYLTQTYLFFPRRVCTGMLKDYHVIHWWLSEGISVLLGMYNNWHKPQGGLFF